MTKNLKNKEVYFSTRRKGLSVELVLGKRGNFLLKPPDLSGRIARDCPT